MAETDKIDDLDTQTVEVFDPSVSGYQQSSSEEKQITEPETKPAPEPKLQSASPAPAPEPGPESKLAAVTSQSRPAKPQSRPKPKKSKKDIPTDADGQGKVIAETVVEGFVGSIRAMAARRGGHLLPEDVEALSASFEKQTEKLATSLARTMSKMAESHSKTQWDPERVNAFDRILVKQFSHLLGDDEQAIKNPEIISRRALAGLFSSIRMMCGPERIEQLEQDAYLVMQRVRDDQKDNFEWEVVYEDPRTKHMIRDLIVDIAPHFVELDKRMEWLLSVINAHLTPTSPNAPGSDWKLTDHGLLLLLEALFSEMVRTIETDMGRLKVTKRYGVETLDVILEVIEAFKNHPA